jgi:hypothetical protein
MVEFGEDEQPALAVERENVILLRPAGGAKAPEMVSFDRRELDLILRVYGRKVASGEWRDYAIDMLRERAVFSVFRRTSETPLFTIEKNPKLARRQGAYCVAGSHGQVLKRGRELAQVLALFDRKPKLATI